MKFRVLTAIVFLFSVALFVAAQGQPAPVDEQAIQKEVMELYRRIGSVPQDQRDDAAKLIQQGTEAHDRRNHDQAIEFFRKALEKDPLSWAAWGEMANTYQAMGDRDKALDAIVRSIALNPRVGYSFIVKGTILDYMGLDTQAIDAYRKAVVLEGNPWLAWLNMGITYMRRKEFDLAENALNNAKRARPEHPSPYYHMATLAQIQGWTYVEEDNLTRFTELAKGDPRLEQAQKRLKELTTQNITINPQAPFPAIHMAEQMFRTLWHREKHRQTFPDAKAYFPSLEEEHAVWTGVLEMWREEKAKNKKAKDSTYDAVLRAADAGFLDEYLAVNKQQELGDRGKTWLETHKERVAAFQTWAKKAGIATTFNPQPEEKAKEAAPGLVEILVKTTVDSPVKYTMTTNPTEQELQTFFTAEAKRFSASLDLVGNDRLDCSQALEQGMALADKGIAARAFTSVFRCFSPTSEEWQKAVKNLAGVGLSWRFPALPRLGVLFDKKDEIEVKVSSSPDGLMYTLAKAAWRREESLRTRYGGEKTYRPSFQEELYAWTVAAQGYFNSKTKPQDKGQTFNADPFMENLLLVVSSGQEMRGFVLLEVIHKGYGIPLTSLSENDAKAVADYIANSAFVSQTKR